MPKKAYSSPTLPNTSRQCDASCAMTVILAARQQTNHHSCGKQIHENYFRRQYSVEYSLKSVTLDSPRSEVRCTINRHASKTHWFPICTLHITEWAEVVYTTNQCHFSYLICMLTGSCRNVTGICCHEPPAVGRGASYTAPS